MVEDYFELMKNLNDNSASVRLESIKMLKQKVDKGEIKAPDTTGMVNNHIHTTYSFSPYSPSKALWMAYCSGLNTAGIIDHDSVSGVREFVEAGRILGIATTVGVECRVNFSGTPLQGKNMNNPDQKSIAYVVLHGIPHTNIDEVTDFFKPYTQERNKRNCLMIDRLNGLMKPCDVQLSFENDVKTVSKYAEGGSITERHILFALSRKLVDTFGRGQKLLSFLRGELKLNISPRIESYLVDNQNDFYEYDLLGVLKSELLGSIYIDAEAECPDVRDIIKFSDKIGAICSYAYLGDVDVSPTGDKKKQKFEDDYIELLFEVIKSLGFKAFTYMPSRNSLGQLRKVKSLCEKYELFQISGEDINSPRQPLVCSVLENEEFTNLIDSTWALIGHEKAASESIDKGMFSTDTIKKYPVLDKRIKVFKEIGKM
ncbi:MAG: PHP domain-containing protein [Clostridia bacterium]|nr:PHP domain-containing protein [Clostridia bacterium]